MTKNKKELKTFTIGPRTKQAEGTRPADEADKQKSTTEKKEDVTHVSND